MPRKIILLAVKLHDRCPRRQSQSVIRRGSRHPSLHQRRHIHGNITPCLAHLHHLRRRTKRRHSSKRDAVLTPRPIHRLHADQPARIRPIAIQPQGRPRHLRRRRPRRQRRKIKLEQRRIPATHIQIRDRSAIRRRPRAVHMDIRHQRRLNPKRPQTRSPHSRKSCPKHPSPTNQLHPTPSRIGPPTTQVRVRTRASPSFNDPNSAMHVAGAVEPALPSFLLTQITGSTSVLGYPRAKHKQLFAAPTNPRPKQPAISVPQPASHIVAHAGASPTQPRHPSI